jgi:cell division protein DivIC
MKTLWSKILALWERIPKWMRNKYSYTTLAFFIYLLFFDQHNLISQYQLRAELNDLRESQEWYEVQIGQTRSDLEELLTNDEKLEKFAREKYLMKKDGEDIFVIVRE